MPRVPFEAPSVELQTGGMPTVRAFDVQEQPDFRPKQIAEAGEAMQRFGSGLSAYGNEQARHAQKLQDEFDEAAAREGDNAYQAFLADRMTNPENGFLTTTAGKQSFESLSTYRDDIAKKRKEIEDSLPNEMARKLFYRAANAHDLQNSTRMNEHAAKGLQGWKVEQLAAGAQLDAKLAPDLWGMYNDDGEANGAFLDKVEAAVVKAGNASKMDGDPPEKTKLIQDRMRAQAYGTVIERRMKSNPAEAYQIIQSSRSILGEDLATKLQEQLQPHTDAKLGMDAAGIALGRNANDLGLAISELEALRVSGGLSTEAYKHAESHARTLDLAFRQANQARGAKTLDEMVNAAMQNGWRSTQEALNAVPGAQKQMEELGVWDKFTAFINSGGQFKDDENYIKKFMELPAAQRNRMDDAQLYQDYWGHVSVQTYNRMSAMRKGRSGAGTGGADGKNVATRDETDKVQAMYHGIISSNEMSTIGKDDGRAVSIKFMQLQSFVDRTTQQLIEEGVPPEDARNKAFEIAKRQKADGATKYQWEKTAVELGEDPNATGVRSVQLKTGELAMPSEFSIDELKLAEKNLRDELGPGYQSMEVYTRAVENRKSRLKDRAFQREQSPGVVTFDTLKKITGMSQDEILAQVGDLGAIAFDDVILESAPTKISGDVTSPGSYISGAYGKETNLPAIGISRAAFNRLAEQTPALRAAQLDPTSSSHVWTFKAAKQYAESLIQRISAAESLKSEDVQAKRVAIEKILQKEDPKSPEWQAANLEYQLLATNFSSLTPQNIDSAINHLEQSSLTSPTDKQTVALLTYRLDALREKLSAANFKELMSMPAYQQNRAKLDEVLQQQRRKKTEQK